MTKRAAISKKIRFEVMKRDSFKCQYCGRAAPDIVLVIDHIHPVADGGDNDITNLITSCFDCNAGKSDRKLSDSTTMAKRKKQLDELQERREQIEMMAAWQIELIEIEDTAVEEVNNFWKKLTNNYSSLSEYGKKNFKALIKKYGFSSVLECLKISANRYLEFADDTPEANSIEKTLDYVEKILRSKKNMQEKPYLNDLYYTRAILADRFGDYLRTDWKITRLLEECYIAGTSFEAMKEIAISSRTISDFKNKIEEAKKGHG